MIPVQYRDPETEEILERRYEDGAPPAIGTKVQIGFERFEVLYRWQCVPTSCIVYVRRVAKEATRAAHAAA
jgi:hypothetical protein